MNISANSGSEISSTSTYAIKFAHFFLNKNLANRMKPLQTVDKIKAKRNSIKPKRRSILEGFSVPIKPIYKTKRSHLSSDVRKALRNIKTKEKQNKEYSLKITSTSLVRKNCMRESTKTTLANPLSSKRKNLTIDFENNRIGSRQQSIISQSKATTSIRNPRFLATDSLCLTLRKQHVKLPTLEYSQKPKLANINFNPVFTNKKPTLTKPRGRFSIFLRNLGKAK